MADTRTWAKRVAAWRASGKSAREFARDGGYAASTLYQHAREGARVVRVVRAAEGRPSTLSIHIAGARIEVGADFDPVTLRAVVAALRDAT